MLNRLDLRIGGDKYQMIKKIGSGAFGEIYKGKSKWGIYYGIYRHKSEDK